MANFSLDVDIDHCFPVIHGKFIEWADGHSTGVTEQYVELAKALLGKVYEFQKILRLLTSVMRYVTLTFSGSPGPHMSHRGEVDRPKRGVGYGRLTQLACNAFTVTIMGTGFFPERAGDLKRS